MVWGDSARKLKMNENMNPLRERCFQHYLEGLVEHDKSIFIDYPYLDQLLCSLYDGLLMAQTRIIPGAILNRRSARLKETLVAEFGDQGQQAVAAALETCSREYGAGAAQTVRSFENTDFNQVS